MRYIYTLNERGEPRRKPMRNCDRCANLADAKGKFAAEDSGAYGPNYWRRLAQWAFREVE